MQRFNAAPRRQDGEKGAAVRESDRRLRYGGPWFSAASALPLAGLIRDGRVPALAADVVRQPARGAALLRLLLRTRSEELRLSESSAGQALRDYFNVRAFGVFPRNRLCRGVLLLPRDHSEYLRGRSRQALRTNLRRASHAGITCETVIDRSRVLDELTDVFRLAGDREADAWRATLARREVTLMVARQKCGRPLAIAGAVVDDAVCLIIFALAISHEARWALHDHLVRTLIARRVRYLLADGGGPFGALGFTTNVQHYQQLLGYELRHLVPAKPHSVARRRRLSPSLGVAAAAALFLSPASATVIDAAWAGPSQHTHHTTP
jgi:hypothetical protein